MLTHNIDSAIDPARASTDRAWFNPLNGTGTAD